MHALAGSPESYAFERDGGVTPHFVEDFVAKTKNQEQSPWSLDPSADDRKICPVRALRIYLQRTEAFRSNKRRLFVSYNLEYNRDITVVTLARWV